MSSLRGRNGIFISYRREETAAQAGRLYDHLSDHFGEDRVFMDVDSIAIGTDFTKAVIQAVSGCSILLALIGRHWSAITDIKGIRRIDYPDDFVRVEIETALQRDIRVVPVLVDGAVLPQAAELPLSLRPLVLRQARELSHTSFRSEVSRLIAAVDEILDAKLGRSAEAPKTPSRVAVTQTGRWKLEPLGTTFSTTSFRLSSGGEVHDITFNYGKLRDAIIVDGKKDFSTPVIRNNKEYTLSGLSSIVGSLVTVRIRRVRGILTLKIGDQVLICKNFG